MADSILSEVSAEKEEAASIEEAFEEMTDTATIFSLRDYLTTPAFSADHLESERRKRRKRGKASDGASSSSSSSTPRTASQVRGEARRTKRAAHATLADFIAECAAAAAKK